MATPLLLLLPLLMSVGFSSVPFFASADCSSDKLLREDGEQIIKTKNAPQVGGTSEIETTVYVSPKGGFQGMGLRVEDGTGEYHFAWFPLVPEDPCLPQRGELGEMKMKAWRYGSIHPYRLKFQLRYGQCFKVCEEDKEYWNDLPSLQSLSVIGRGFTGWRLTKRNNSCKIKEISQPTNRNSSTCLQFPPQGTTSATTRHPPTAPFSHSTTSTSTTKPPSITSTPHPSSLPTAHGRIGTSGTVVVAWVLGVVVVVTTVVVAVVVVWRICRQRSPPSYVIRHRPQPPQPLPSHSHVSINSLYEPFNNFDNRQ